MLLGAGGLYIAHIGGAGTLFNTDAFPLEYPGDYQALNRTFTGQAMPLLTAHEASTGRKEVVSFDTDDIHYSHHGTLNDTLTSSVEKSSVGSSGNRKIADQLGMARVTVTKGRT